MIKTVVKISIILFVFLFFVCSNPVNNNNNSNPITQDAGTITDIDGNVYHTIKIGNQVWTVENLRVTKYNDGSPIALITSTEIWAYATTPKYCFYEDITSSDNIKKYGALYNWYVVSPANHKKIAPAGWHVPSEAEWDTLQNYLIVNGYNWDGTTTGNKIAKSLAAKTDWRIYSTTESIGCELEKNNSSGFSGLPGGYRSSNDGKFYSQNNYGYWWSTTEGVVYLAKATTAYLRLLGYDHGNLNSLYIDKGYCNSVRLVRD